MENIWVNLSVPLQTETGDFLIYLLDLIRTQNSGGGPPLQIPVTPDVSNTSLSFNYCAHVRN